MVDVELFVTYVSSVANGGQLEPYFVVVYRRSLDLTKVKVCLVPLLNNLECRIILHLYFGGIQCIYGKIMLFRRVLTVIIVTDALLAVWLHSHFWKVIYVKNTFNKC